MLQVSVIIPTYNRAGYLSQALQSVFDQSYAPYEIIVIDDGSTDDTAQVMRDWEARVRYCRQEHRGVSAARNRGLELATGEVIAWLDADDLWDAGFLATMVLPLEADPQLDGIYSSFCYIDVAGNVLSQAGFNPVPPSELFASLAEADFIATPAIVVRKKCYDHVGSFDPRFDICEDYDMWLRLAWVFRIMGVPKALVKVRVHESNTQGNLDKLAKYLFMLMDKHFGPLAEDVSIEPDLKRRAYASAFRLIAFKRIQAGDPEQGWSLLERGISIWPEFLSTLETLYELACGDQSRAYRGRADLLDIEANGAEMLRQLDALFTRASPRLYAARNKTYGNAYLALGMLSDQAGQWGKARRYLVQAARAHPALVGSYPVIRRFLKLFAGQRLVSLVRNFRQGEPTQAHYDDTARA